MQIAELKQLVAESLNFPDTGFSDEANFRDIHGYDSVNMLIMLVDLEEQAGLHISADKAGSIKSFADIIAAAKEQKII